MQAITGISTNIKTKLPIIDYFDMKQSILLDQSRQENIKDLVNIANYEKKQIKRIKSISQVNRMAAAVQLGLLASDTARLALENRILQEPSYPVRLYIANALADIGNQESIHILVESLNTSHSWYSDKVNILIAD